MHAFNEIIKLQQAHLPLHEDGGQMLKREEGKMSMIRVVFWLCCIQNPYKHLSVIAWKRILTTNS